jgi:hypothetical protein
MNNKDLISQYVNIGMRIPEHQMNQLSNNDLKSYLRMRTIAIGSGPYDNTTELLGYEYKKMNDEERDNLIKSLRHSSIEDAMLTLNWRTGSDDFVRRLIRLRSSDNITDNIIFILRNTHSTISIIYELINVRGPIFNGNQVMSIILKYFENTDTKLNFCMEYLKLLNNKIKKNMTIINSPISGMLNNFNSLFCKTLIKYFIMLNLKKPNGNKIDGETFFTLLNNTSDDTFDDISEIMKQNLDLYPNQLEFIEQETNNG